MDHLVMLRIIVEECHNDKSNLFCCFVEFRKAFDTVPRNNLWNILEELKVPFELILILAHDLGTKNQSHQRIINKYS